MMSAMDSTASAAGSSKVGGLLKNKPLVEAIFELRWALQQGQLQPGQFNFDPNFRVLLGRFFDRVSTRFPAHEALPTAAVPEAMTPHMVHHRFRQNANGWPLIQIGPGILTYNQTADYTWKSFFSGVGFATGRLFESYPSAKDFQITTAVLRYIDAYEFDYSSKSAAEFLRRFLKIDVGLPEGLFNEDINPIPLSLNLQTSFACLNPKATVTLLLSTGQRDEKPAILSDLSVTSTFGTEEKFSQDKVPRWLDAAHAVAHQWFFRLIEGELESKFNA
jgi:uncharacterized protein (TIGR04255 family)